MGASFNTENKMKQIFKVIKSKDKVDVIDEIFHLSEMIPDDATVQEHATTLLLEFGATVYNFPDVEHNLVTGIRNHLFTLGYGLTSCAEKFPYISLKVEAK